jgi:hypothetical protein
MVSSPSVLNNLFTLEWHPWRVFQSGTLKVREEERRDMEWNGIIKDSPQELKLHDGEAFFYD